jgi:hypothetical protein
VFVHCRIDHRVRWRISVAGTRSRAGDSDPIANAIAIADPRRARRRRQRRRPPTPSPAPAPQVSAISPTTLAPPGRLTVSGTNLDRVASARLGATPLAIASQSATSLGLDVPAGASTAFLTLVDAAGTARQSSQQVTIVGPVTVASLSPASLLTGASLTIAGSGLDRASSVEFAGGASAGIASRSGSTSITVTVPSNAITGPVTVVSSTGERAASSTALTVIPRITVTNPSTTSVAAGGTVTLSGSGFGEVAGVLVGSAAATIGQRSATQLSFAVPAGVSCGSISLLSASQPTVFGGAVAVGAGCALRVESIEFAQLMSQTVSDTRQRLVPGRETWVRAYVLSARPVSRPPPCA